MFWARFYKFLTVAQNWAGKYHDILENIMIFDIFDCNQIFWIFWIFWIFTKNKFYINIFRAH